MTGNYRYMLRRGPAPHRADDTVYIGTYYSKEAAMEAAVPGHPEEWVWLDEDRVWYHGGGNFPGEWFVIIKQVA